MHDLIDLGRYPLDRPGGARWQALVDDSRETLARTGMFNLEGFLRPAAIAQALAEIAPVMAAASFEHRREHNIYFRRDVPDLPPDHPALRRFQTASRTICADQIEGSVVTRLYDWPPLAAFLAAAMDKPALYPMDDRIACANVMRYGAGEALNWHFDRSEFTTTLLLQAPEAGGVFEYRTDLRSAEDPNYDGVARLLAGQDPAVQRMTAAPGTLNVFRGRNTAHRVTPVEGGTPRIIAVFSFFDRPGVRFTDEERMGFYGRAA